MTHKRIAVTMVVDAGVIGCVKCAFLHERAEPGTVCYVCNLAGSVVEQFAPLDQRGEVDEPIRRVVFPEDFACQD
jgi:hypothetical protein